MHQGPSETITITDSDGDSDTKPASQGSSHSQAARGRQVGGKCSVGVTGPTCVMLLPAITDHKSMAVVALSQSNCWQQLAGRVAMGSAAICCCCVRDRWWVGTPELHACC